MAALSGMTVAVVGAGAFGLVTSLFLVRRGAVVTVYDPAALGDNASGVAAGMLAPALESALDAGSAGRFHLLRQGRDLWPELLNSLDSADAPIDRSGALFLGDEAQCVALRDRLVLAGADAHLVSPRRAAALSPGLAAGAFAQAVFTPEDWRLAPRPTLQALARTFLAEGGRFSQTPVTAVGSGLMAGGAPLCVEVVVIAGGIQSDALAAAAPEAALVSPVKGQILHFHGGPGFGPVIRTSQGYIAPQAHGAVAGATMEPGPRDRLTDDPTLARLRANAQAVFPVLSGVSAHGLAGVRAATPDGLPMVGRSRGDGSILLCIGARRNGWLLAPLVAELVAATLMGADTGALGLALSPGRFTEA